MKTFVGYWRLNKSFMVAKFTAESLEAVQPQRIVKVASLIIDAETRQVVHDGMGVLSPDLPDVPPLNIDGALKQMYDLEKNNKTPVKH